VRVCVALLQALFLDVSSKLSSEGVMHFSPLCLEFCESLVVISRIYVFVSDILVQGVHILFLVLVKFVSMLYILLYYLSGYVAECNQTDWCIPGDHITDTQQCISQTLMNHRIQFTCNSAGTEEFSDDDTHVSKYV
jgi:hypothetical protein